jgi:TonB family protein
MNERITLILSFIFMLMFGGQATVWAANQPPACPAGSQLYHGKANSFGADYDWYECREPGKTSAGRVKMQICHQWEGTHWNPSVDVPCGSAASVAEFIPKSPQCSNSEMVLLASSTDAHAPFEKKCLPVGWLSLPPTVNGKCPAGFFPGTFIGGNADVCFGPGPYGSIQELTPEEKRVTIAWHTQKTGEILLPDRHERDSATGIEKRVFKISLPSVSEKDLSENFNGSQAFAQNLWKSGFKFTAITDGRQYWASLLSEEGYGNIYGPFNTRPALDVLTDLQARTSTTHRTLFRVDPYAPPDGKVMASLRRLDAAKKQLAILNAVKTMPNLNFRGLRVYATTPASPQGEVTSQDYRLTIEIEGLPLPQFVVPFLSDVLSIKEVYRLGFKEIYIKNTVGVRLGTIGCAVSLQADGAHPLYCMKRTVVQHGLGEGTPGLGYEKYYQWPQGFVIHSGTAVGSASSSHEEERPAMSRTLARTGKPSGDQTVLRQQFAEELTGRMSKEISWCAAGRSGELLAGYVTTSQLSPGTFSLLETASPLYRELYRRGFRFVGFFDRDQRMKSAALTASGAVPASLTGISDADRKYLSRAIDVLMHVANGVDESDYRRLEGGKEVTECIPSQRHTLPGDSNPSPNQNTASGPYKVGGDVSSPVAIYHPEPSYSPKARAAKFQGTCVLWVVIDAQGNVTQVRVAHSLGMGLDENAVNTVKTWKFNPAMRNGAPVPVKVGIEVSFRLF